MYTAGAKLMHSLADGIAAIRRVARVAAVGVPMAMAAPAMSFAGAAGASGGPLALHYSPQITVHSAAGDPAALKKVIVDTLGEHAHDLVRVLDRELAKRNRTKF